MPLKSGGTAHPLDKIVHEYSYLWRRKPGRLEQQMEGYRWRLMVNQNAAQAAGGKFGTNLPGRDPYDSGALLCSGHKGVEAIYPKPT